MNDPRERAVQLLRLPEDAYFAFDDDRQQALQEALSPAAPPPPPGTAPRVPEAMLALGGPASVRLKDRTSVPVLLASVETGRRRWEVSFDPNLHLLLRDVERGALHVVQPFVDSRRGGLQLRSGGGDAPDPAAARTVYSTVRRIDLKARAPESVGPGKFAVTAISRELLTNTVRIAIEGEPSPPVPEAPAAPEWLHTKAETKGDVATAFEVRPPTGDGDGATVTGTVQVAADGGIRRTADGKPVWTGHLILVQVDERPVVIDLPVPAQEVVRSDGSAAFNASFSCNTDVLGPALRQGDVYVYLDIGPAVLGPKHFHLPR